MTEHKNDEGLTSAQIAPILDTTPHRVKRARSSYQIEKPQRPATTTTPAGNWLDRFVVELVNTGLTRECATEDYTGRRSADLQGADLRGANLRDASMPEGWSQT